MEPYSLDKDFESLRELQEENENQLLETPNVVGVALGHKIKGTVETKKPCISVFVSQKLPRELLHADELVTPKFGDVATDVIETGPIFAGGAPPIPGIATTRFVRGTAYPREGAPDGAMGNGAATDVVAPVTERELMEEVGMQVLTGRVRPAEGGYSVGHYQITAGTMSTAVFDAAPFPSVPSRYYILSNNHVLANSNAARVGDPILQPGPVDGGQIASDVIGRLARFVPIRFGGPINYVDAAIAEAPFHWIDREIHWIGYVRGIRGVTVGEIVQKTGRTTNYSTGRVTNVNATVNVNYGSSLVARMARQIVTTNMSAPGDSGSLLCDMAGNAVGLLFAGSATVTIHNHIAFVQALLGIRLV